MTNWKWWHIAALILEIAGLASMVLAIVTDLNDGVFFPVALGCVGAANLLLLVMNIRHNSKNGGSRHT